MSEREPKRQAVRHFECDEFPFERFTYSRPVRYDHNRLPEPDSITTS